MEKISICIPSYNRGDLALELVNTLLKRIENKKYIEVVISNNGSDTDCLGYKKIKEIKNSQLRYFEYEINQGFEKNLRTVISLAESPLCLILSDEDDVVVDNLDYYISFFETHPTLAIMYAKVKNHPTFSNDEVVYLKKGYEAARAFYGDAYISGIIFNKRIFGNEELNQISDKYSNGYVYKYIPHFFWLGEAALHGDFAYSPLHDLIMVGENLASRDLDCAQMGNLSVSRVMLPESYIENSSEIIGYIAERNASFDVKTVMLQQYLRYAYSSIHWLDLAQKANGEIVLERRTIINDIFCSIDRSINRLFLDETERRVLCDIAKYEFLYARETYNRDAYIDSLVYMPDIDKLRNYFQQNEIKNVGIYGVGNASEVPAVMIYRNIRSLASVILIDRDLGRFQIDASNPGRMQKTDSDFYKLDLVSLDSLPDNLDLIIVACAGFITEVRESLKAKTNATVVSVIELYKMIETFT